MNPNWSNSLETPNLGKKVQIFCRVCILLKPSVNSNWGYSQEKNNNLDQNWLFCWSRVTLKFDGCFEATGHLFYATSSSAHHAMAIGEFKLKLQSRKHQFMSKLTIWCSVWHWNLTDDPEKTTRQHFYTDSSFEQHFVAISVFKLELQYGNAEITSVTLTFNLWPWAFAWTPLLSMVITPENCMILWKERCEKGAMNGQTDGQTDRQTYGKNEGQRILVH